MKHPIDCIQLLGSTPESGNAVLDALRSQESACAIALLRERTAKLPVAEVSCLKNE